MWSLNPTLLWLIFLFIFLSRLWAIQAVSRSILLKAVYLKYYTFGIYRGIPCLFLILIFAIFILYFFLDGIAGFTQTLEVNCKAPPFKEVVFAVTHDGGWAAKPEWGADGDISRQWKHFCGWMLRLYGDSEDYHLWVDPNCKCLK